MQPSQTSEPSSTIRRSPYFKYLHAPKAHKRKAPTSDVPEAKKQRNEAATTALPSCFEENPKCLVKGSFVLAKGAYLDIIPAAIKPTEQEFADFWDLGMDDSIVAPTPNPMNRKYNIIRKQGTYGAAYHFGGQKSQYLGPLSDAPDLVKKCVADAQKRAGPELARLYTGAHVNWYKGKKAWLHYHQDTENARSRGTPIFSYTFLRKGNKRFRYFTIANDRKGDDLVACVAARNGDLIVMRGEHFQSKFYHAVPKPSNATKQRPRDFVDQERINITVRAWGGSHLVKDV